MFTKVYEKIKEYIRQEYKILITSLIILLVFTIKLPFYIDIPGGITDISKRIQIDNIKSESGTLNYAYVSEMRATLPTYLIALLNKDWDIIKKEEVVLKNETEKDAQFRDELSLKEALCNALYAGFKEANVEFEIENVKIYATSIYEKAETDIEIGDQIIEIGNNIINTKEDLKYINNLQEGKEITITVLNNKKEYIRKAKLITMDDKTVIGIAIGETFDIKTDHKININYNPKESGPSGGLMSALGIYSSLTKKDLTKNRKIVGTGTIDIDGNIGEIGGVKYKLMGAVKNKADIFLVPNGENYLEALKLKEEKNYNIKIIGVKTLKQAIDELEKS